MYNTATCTNKDFAISLSDIQIDELVFIIMYAAENNWDTVSRLFMNVDTADS